MNSQMTDLALAGKCGGRGASGSSGAVARGVGRCDRSRSASASMPKPAAGPREELAAVADRLVAAAG